MYTVTPTAVNMINFTSEGFNTSKSGTFTNSSIIAFTTSVCSRFTTTFNPLVSLVRIRKNSEATQYFVKASIRSFIKYPIRYIPVRLYKIPSIVLTFTYFHQLPIYLLNDTKGPTILVGPSRV